MDPLIAVEDRFSTTVLHQADLRAEAAHERLVHLAVLAREGRSPEREAARAAAHLHRHVVWEIARHEWRMHLLHHRQARRSAFALVGHRAGAWHVVGR